MKNPHRPSPSMMGKHGSKVVTAAVFGVAAYMFYGFRAPAPGGTPTMNPLRTPGVKNIENAYKSGGATSTHTKAYGGTRQGERDEVMKEGGATNNPQGLDQDKLGDEQRPEQAMKPGQMFKDMNYGSKAGK